MNERGFLRLVKERKSVFFDPIFRVSYSRGKRSLNFHLHWSEEIEEFVRVHAMGHSLEHDVASLFPLG